MHAGGVLLYCFSLGQPWCLVTDCPAMFLLLQELEGMDFDEKKEINKRKQMILEGKVRVAAV